MSPGVKVLSIDGDDFGVIPAHSLPPSADPKPYIGITRQILSQLVKNAAAVGRHTDDVPEHHTDNDLRQFHEEEVNVDRREQ